MRNGEINSRKDIKNETKTQTDRVSKKERERERETAKNEIENHIAIFHTGSFIHIQKINNLILWTVA